MRTPTSSPGTRRVLPNGAIAVKTRYGWRIVANEQEAVLCGDHSVAARDAAAAAGSVAALVCNPEWRLARER